MEGITSEMGPAVVALAIAAFAAALALWLRRWLFPAPTRTQLAAEQRKEVEKHSAALVESTFQPARQTLDVGTVATVVPGFSIESFVELTRELFRQTQQQRAQPSPPVRDDTFLPGAADVAFNSGIGLESIGEVTVVGARLVKLSGTIDGCDARVRLRALVTEMRNGAEHLVEVDETWTFGWPPARQQWRVVQVERHWRRILEAPRANRDAEQPSSRVRMDPGLESAREEVDFEAIEAMTQLVVPAWADAVSAGSPGALDGLATVAFQEQVAGEIRRHTAFGTTPHWQLAVHDITPARVLSGPQAVHATVRATGRSTLRLEPAPEAGEASADLPWARYLTFRSTDEGRWLLAWSEDDGEWLV